MMNKEVDETLQEAASFIQNLNPDFLLEEIELISLLIEEMKKALNTGNTKGVKKVMRSIHIIGENQDWALIEAYEC